ncbi:ISL3 family transposase [Rubrivirga sp. S365]|uniref:ISL3 family transposase n=1 Tax=Rubrivirga litoralis TaxID=3075598 RepID=A0ABU3BU99_9BACT|nr:MULTISPECIES: ISL3 family transposase [unclassified Rubrivirga]MDT0632869.1 ISL3 family transposase [Rubrivirga sp. F394]MDT7855173.1 ISL3 family transposase [Rubrivirga sp. S365]MDT7857185.1 ISL3 family transposase [Rubrivirga sp. S365]MDT7857211.1 ISL3 family transposase [Rubrivirga sp. S365]
MAASVVPFRIPGCRLDAVQADPSDLTVDASSKARSAVCPGCGHRSRRVHGLYTRSPADLPVSDRAVGLRLRVRRFRCLSEACPRRTFAEPFPDLVARHARRTDRLAASQVRTGLATGAEPGARLLRDLRMPTSPDTVLRLLHRHPVPEAETPRVLGLDDWAWRKGRSWGTILIDLETRRPVDLLPDRTSTAVSAWLRDHPGVEVVARDRSTEYARAVSEGAPDAAQVADRWHLLHNLRQVLVRHLTSVRGRLRTLPGVESLPASEYQPGRRTAAERAASAASRDRHHARYVEVRRLHAEDGLNALQIAHALRIDRKTVAKYLAADAFPERGRHSVPPSVLAPYQEHLNARWAEGERSALVLYREIGALGYSRSSRPVSRWAQGRRTEPHPRTPRKYLTGLREPVESAPRRGRLPSTRKLAWLLVRDPEALDASETAVLAHVRQDTEVARLHDLARLYNRMVREKRPDDLDGWLEASRTSGISALATFSDGLRRDYAAVRAALDEPWSSGQAEGQINRLKMLKRQMYGRAGFDLLRKRVLCSA